MTKKQTPSTSHFDLGNSTTGPIGMSTTDLSVFVIVTGEASEPDDQSLPGIYGHDVSLIRPVNPLTLTDAEAGAIAEAVLNFFHDHQGIECLDDFRITVKLSNGKEIQQLDIPTMRKEWLVTRVDHNGMIAAIPEADDSLAVTVPLSLFKQLVDLAETTVQDIESGIQEGIYDASENIDIGTKRLAVDTGSSLCEKSLVDQSFSRLNAT